MKKKFRELRLKNSNGQKVIRQLLGCIQEKFDGFNIICVKYSKKLRKKFKPINVIYKAVKQPEKKLCYTTTDISRAYRSSWSQGEKNKVPQGFVYECYYCEKIFARADKHKRHIEKCSGIPGIVYNFNNQNLVTFEENSKYKSDLPMVIYFDRETTVNDSCLDPEQKEMFVVPYVMVVTFHPELEFNRIIVERSFLHAFQKLTTIDYFTEEQMLFVDIKVIQQLKDAAEHVFKKIVKNL